MPAIVIAAGVAAAGGVASAVVSSHAAGKASKAATDAATQNNNLQRDIYNQNKATLSPFVNNGTTAGNYYNALLGLPGANGGANDNRPGAQQAFNTFQNSDGYQFRMGEGMKALNTGYAARGLIQSGAAMKGINSFAQGAASDEFGKYLGQLGNQQAVGLSAANAQAGVGTNYANAVSNNNNSAASAVGNAAIAGANATNGAIGNALNAFGTYAGQSSSYRAPNIARSGNGVVGGDGSGIY